MEEKVLKYIKLLANLLASAVDDEIKITIPEQVDLKLLYVLAKSHSVANMAYVSLKKLGINEDELKDFYDDYKLLILREARQEIMTERLFALFSKNDVDFIPLKGLLLKKLYPYEHYRSSTDVDIFVREEDRTKISEIMQGEGFDPPLCGPDHDTYLKKPMYNFEIHHTIAEKNTVYYSYFKDAFNYSKLDPNFKNKYLYNDEDFYIHLIYHLYKHFSEGGCGIRAFLDIWIFNKKYTDLNREYINKILNEFNLSKFEQVVFRLIEILFENKEPDDKMKKLLVFIAKSSTHGSSEYGNLSRISFKANKAFGVKKYSYFLSRWFRNKESMAENYKYLNKYPFLLPVSWIQKGFKTLFFKRTAIKSELDFIKKADKKAYEFIKDVHEIAGITHTVHKK